MWPRQKENSRQVFLKRAQAYHAGRIYLHSLYRRRSALDDLLLEALVELSLSPYTRVRRYDSQFIIITTSMVNPKRGSRHAQAVLHNACGVRLISSIFRSNLLINMQYYLRSTRYCLPMLLRALDKGSDPDRMKGALYVLWNKGIGKRYDRLHSSPVNLLCQLHMPSLVSIEISCPDVNVLHEPQTRISILNT